MPASNRRSLWAALATLAVAAGLVTAFLQMGSPAELRRRLLDDTRTQWLKNLSTEIGRFHAAEGQLPAELAALTAQPWSGASRRDPETSAPFVYEIVDPLHYRLCAEFARPSGKLGKDEDLGFWRHPQGHHCYEFEVKLKEPKT